MSPLEDRIMSIAHMLDNAPEFDRTEVLVWQVLVRSIDRLRFNHSGRLITKGLSQEEIIQRAPTTVAPLTRKQIKHALERLRRLGYIEVHERSASREIRFQIHLQHSRSVVSRPIE
ncbi:MAG: hypothetical protein ACOCTG_00470 [Bacteroidota bacterium]